MVTGKIIGFLRIESFQNSKTLIPVDTPLSVDCFFCKEIEVDIFCLSRWDGNHTIV